MSEAPPVPEGGRKSKALPTENNEAATGETPAGPGRRGAGRNPKPMQPFLCGARSAHRQAHCVVSLSWGGGGGSPYGTCHPWTAGTRASEVEAGDQAPPSHGNGPKHAGFGL